MTTESRDSFYTTRRDGITLTDYTVWTVPLTLLDTQYARYQDQMRVFLNQTELTYDDGTDPTLTTNKWTAVQGSVLVGREIMGVRFSPLPFTGGSCRVTELAIWENDEYMAYSDFASGTAPEHYDGDNTTGRTVSIGTSIVVNFDYPRLVTKVGLTRSNTSTRDAHTVTIAVNVGTLDDPEWVTVINGAAVGALPALSNPYNPDTDTVQFALEPSTFVSVTRPVVTITPAPATNSDRVTFMRETRQDRPWVYPVGNSYVIGRDLHKFWTQARFIAQEMCDLRDLAPYIGLPPASLNFNDFTTGSQLALGVNDGTSRDLIDYSGIELLEGFPGAPSDPDLQMIVEEGNARFGTSVTWARLSVADYTLDATAKTVTLDTATLADIRARRVTRKDKLWLNINQPQPLSWTSPVIAMLAKQVRFWREESCLIPTFYTGHPLNTTLFPRAWNWLRFTGGGGAFTFGGPYWAGDGAIVVYLNDVVLTEGTDYTINWPQIIFTVPAGTDDVVVIGSGGGGGGSVGIPGDVDDPVDNPEAAGDPIVPVVFPGFDIPLTSGFTLAVGATNIQALADGDWEGESEVTIGNGNAPSSSFNPLVLRIEVTAAGIGAYTVGAKEVWYMHRLCPDQTSLRAMATARDSNGDGAWDSSSEAAAALGCLQPLGADRSFGLVQAAMNVTGISSENSPLLNMAIAAVNAMEGPTVQGEVENIPSFGAWFELGNQSILAEDAGVVDADGFTSEQFENYLDPDVDFIDFDIPLP